MQRTYELDIQSDSDAPRYAWTMAFVSRLRQAGFRTDLVALEGPSGWPCVQVVGHPAALERYLTRIGYLSPDTDALDTYAIG